MQVQTFQDVPYIPLWVFLQNAAYRNDLPVSSRGVPDGFLAKSTNSSEVTTPAARDREQASEEWGKQ
jgi:hypothetical protein